uniref:RING-type domain-containing protein n=1 Tax=Loa loa TaxID=7209 RepID=A0A1I7VHM3_LOALO
MGEERGAQSQPTTIWHGGSLRDSFLTVVQNAGSQEMRNELVEDFRTALDILAQAAPAPNMSSVEAESGNDRVDTVIIVDEDSASSTSSGSGTRHRLTPSINGNQFGRLTTDATENSGEYSSANDDAINTNLQRELSRLRALLHRIELQRFWLLVLNVLPFFIIVFLKAVVDGFFSLISVLVALFLFHIANSTFMASRREKRYFHLLQSFTSSVFFFNFQSLFYGLDSIYIPMAFMSRLTNPITFFATLHAVLVVDFAVKITTVTVKATLTVLPTKFIGNRRLRRLFQWIEYTSQLYRYILPIPQWTRYLSYSLFSTPLTYFSDHFFAVLYIIYKVCLIKVIGKRWFESTRRIFRLTTVGLKVPTGEEDSAQCTICFNDFCNPVRLSCGHVFCEECIGTWLDNEHTCPMCRATVAQEDNLWKSGDTTYSPQLC